MIQLINVNKIYTSGNEKVHAIRNLNAILPDKGLIFIVGPSGGGKSTLLNLLGGIDVPTSGQVRIDGQDIAKLNPSSFNKFLNSYVGFVFQEYNILSNLNLFENVSLSLELKGIPPHKRIKQVSTILEQVGLTGFEKRKVSQLSGGQKQRIAIARALVKNPKFIIADEPTGNLDSETGQTIFELFQALSKERLVIIVSHDAESAQKYADRIIEIDNGDLVSDSSPIVKELPTKPFELERVSVPFKTTVKLAIKSMVRKRIRFLAMAIITGISLAFLSFMLELRDDPLKQNIHTSVNNGYVYAEIRKKREIRGTGNGSSGDYYDQFYAVAPPLGEYDIITTLFPDYNIHHFKTTQIDLAGMAIENNDFFYKGSITSIVRYRNENRFDLLMGRIPTTGEKEVLITDYVASMLIHYRKIPGVETFFDLVNRRIDLNVHSQYKIVGILRTNFEKYTHLSNLGYSPVQERTYLAYESDFRFMNSIVIPDPFFTDESDFITPNVTMTRDNTASIYLNNDYYTFLKLYDNSRDVPDLLYGRLASSPGEVVIDGALAKNLFAPRLNLNSPGSLFNDWRWRINNQTITLLINPINDLSAKIEVTLRVVGMTASGGMGLHTFDYDEAYTRIIQSSEEIITELPKNGFDAHKMFLSLAKEDYILDVWAFRELIDTFSIDSFILLASQVGLFVFATFSIGILWTIITLEIVDSKKEIGILRSLGLGGRKVSILFVFEVVVIGLIALAFAYFTSNHAIETFNNTLYDDFRLINLTMYTRNPLSILYLAGFLFITSGLAIFFPIFQISKQKIIDVINERSSI